MTDKEQRNNRRTTEHAIVQQTREELTITSETVADLQRATRGDISFSSVIDNLNSI